MKRLVYFLFCFVCFAVVLMTPAYAYIDPSAVTYSAQAIAAVVVALGALITVFRHKIVAFFKKNKADNSRREIHVIEDPEGEPQEQETVQTKE